MNSDAFKERLKVAMAGESGYSFAKKCGIAESLIRKYLAGESLPGLDKLITIAAASDVSVEWLATGEGPMKRGDKRGHGESREEATEYRGERDLLPADEYVLVPRYDVTASAGPGALVQSEQVVDHLAFKRDWVKRLGLEAGQLALITAKGDSMEPTIRDGYLLLVDLRQHQATADAIYILRFDHELIAKRLQRLFTGEVKIKSDNPAYDEQLVPVDQVNKLNIVGKVVWGGGRM
jgi:phage repressor protein C with HTH and peptisase S24 domain